jgi:hypothetical protein
MWLDGCGDVPVGGDAVKFSIVFHGAVSGQADGDELAAGLDALMETLVSSGHGDPAIGTTGKSGEIEVALTVEGEDLEQAIARAGRTVRDAFDHSPAASGWRIDWRAVQALKAESVGA